MKHPAHILVAAYDFEGTQARYIFFTINLFLEFPKLLILKIITLYNKSISP